MNKYKIVPRPMKTADGREIPFAEILTAVTYALDLTDGQPQGHSVRSCWIGYHIGRQLGLKEEQLWELYYTLLLKDAGCSSNAARLFELYGADDLKIKCDFRTVDHQKRAEVARFILKHAGIHDSTGHKLQRFIYFAAQGKKVATELIQTRCESGAGIAKELGFTEAVANGIYSLDEHFNGKGRPAGLTGEAIPIYSRIALVAQVADVFQKIGGKFAALKEVRERQDTWFDPQVVKAFEEVAEDAAFWETLNKDDILQTIIGLEPASKVIKLTEDLLDTIAKAFSKIIDSKSPFTFGHSTRVAEYAVAIAKLDGMEPDRMRWLNRAALLHDIGKLGVSNAILDKPGSLTKEEYELVKQHPRHTHDILSKISIFNELAVIAGAHHERLDGLGYPNGLKADDIAMETRILTVADIYDALTAERPYREAMRNFKAFEILNGMRNGAIEGKYVDLLRKNVE